MAFPTDRLPVKVELALGADLTAAPGTWSWTDVTQWVRVQQGITMTRGRRDESSTAPPGSCRLTFDNRDGRFTPRNPLGAYYGSLRRNTPLRVRVDPGTGFVTRFTGYVSEWPPRWDLSGRDAYVPVEANGILRRLMQGEAPLVDPLHRAITTNSTAPQQYWPLTDGSTATQGRSGLPGASAMVAFGILRFAAETDLPGSSALPNLDGGGRLRGEVPTYFIGANPAHAVDFWFKSSSAASTTHYPLEFYGDRALARFEVEITSTAVNVLIYSTLNTELTGGGLSYTADLTDDAWHNVKIAAVSGLAASVDVNLYVGGTLRDTINFPTTTIGHVTAVTANPRSLAGGPLVSVGHIAVFNGNVTTDFTVAGSGHAGEAAGTRIQRICSESSVPYLASGNESDSELMGPQPNTLTGILRDCEAADGGVLYEALTGEIAYQTRRARYNRTVALALNQDSGHIAAPPEPTDDDQLLRNDVTATRLNGSSARSEDSTHIAANGRYDEEVTINVATDDVLDDHAGWRVRLGTVDVMRWPSISLNFARAPSLITSWLAADIGARATVANPPDQVIGDTVDVLADGYTEYVDGVRTWTADLMCVPALPWTVAEADADPRVDTDGAGLDSSITTSATSFSVTSTGDNWTTAAADFPLDINIGGERIRLSSISGGGATQTFTVASSGRAINGVVKAHAGGSAVTVWEPAYVPL